MEANNVVVARRREPVGKPVIIERVGAQATIYRINDLNPIGSQTSMELIYNRPRPVYFLNILNGQNAHIKEYIKKSGNKETGRAYIKTFRLKPGQVLRLIDMSQLATRAWVASMMTEAEVQSLNISFPLEGEIVRRVSGDDQERDDLIVATAICDILAHHPVADGYYSAPQPSGFHAEIGLCPSAFPKFVHIDTVVREFERPLGAAGRKKPIARRKNAGAGASAAAFPSFVYTNLESPSRIAGQKTRRNNAGAGSKVRRGLLFAEENNSPNSNSGLESPPQLKRTRLFKKNNNNIPGSPLIGSSRKRRTTRRRT